MKKLITGVTLAVLALAATMLMAAPVATAKDGDVLRRGTCTGGATSKIKLSEEDGRIEVEFEVDQNRSGVRWKVRVRRNGKLAIKTSAVTGGRSGSFSVERKIADPAGRDRISARATSPSGEVCRAALTI